MTKTFTQQQIKRFKREATALKKASDLTQSEALDQIAKRKFFSNWSLLMRASNAIEPSASAIASKQPSDFNAKVRDVYTHFIEELDDEIIFSLCWNGSIWIDVLAVQKGKVSTNNLHALGPCGESMVRQYASDLRALCLIDFDGIADSFVLATDEDDDGNPCKPGPCQVMYTAEAGRRELLECFQSSWDGDMDRLMMEVEEIDARE